MTDLEKVMQWLETCVSGCEEGCPYEYKNLVYRVECKADLMRDALALLKEQEPVPVYEAIKSGVEKALNKPIVDGKSITEWAAIGMKAPRWISVKNRLPDKSNEYIICAIDEDGEQFVTSDNWIDTIRDWYLIDKNTYSKVTHWMPLPEPPEVN